MFVRNTTESIKSVSGRGNKLTKWLQCNVLYRIFVVTVVKIIYMISKLLLRVFSLL